MTAEKLYSYAKSVPRNPVIAPIEMMLSFLKKPYPYLGDLRRSLFSNLIIGAFVAFFLVVFQPFNIDQWHTENKFLKLAGFGIISFLVPMIVSFFLVKIMSVSREEDKWNIGKEILSVLAILLLIAFGNLLYGRILGVMPLNLEAYTSALACVVLVGIFPVFIYVTRKHNRLLRLNLEQSQKLNRQLAAAVEEKTGTPEAKAESHPVPVTLIAENEKDKLVFLPAELLFIESADNYSDVVLFNGAKKREVFRSSLRRIETQLQHPLIIRCHRTFIVNLEQVTNVEGNAAGYKLTLRHTDERIPVSRSYVPIVNEKLGRDRP